MRTEQKNQVNGEEYISVDDLIDNLHRYFNTGFTSDKWWNSGHVMQAIRDTQIAEAKAIEPELYKAFKLLIEEYEIALRSPLVNNPLAFALYQTWKEVDGRK